MKGSGGFSIYNKRCFIMALIIDYIITLLSQVPLLPNVISTFCEGGHVTMPHYFHRDYRYYNPYEIEDERGLRETCDSSV